MAVTLPNMGLTQWNLATDSFSYTELAANFAALDDHDHTSGNGVQIPTGGIANGAVTLAKLATSSVDATKILDASVTDAELASPNNATWKPVLRAAGFLPGGSGNAIYFFSDDGNGLDSGGSLGLTLADTGIFMSYLQASNYAVTGKTTQLRIALSVILNATAAIAMNFTGILRPLDTNTGTSGSSISIATGSTVGNTAQVAVTGGTTSFKSVAYSTEFAFPANNHYFPLVSTNSAIGANQSALISYELQMRHT